MAINRAALQGIPGEHHSGAGDFGEEQEKQGV